MVKDTLQGTFWQGIFGDTYVSRNSYSPRSLDAFYRSQVGVTRSQINEEFLGKLPKDIRILEVGANIGMQLRHLQLMGFTNLWGIEINKKALGIARKTLKDIHIIPGNALDIPFKDAYFDLVFTSGVLIHIAPRDRKKVISEIYRVSKKYIWGYEYFSDRFVEIPYREHTGVLWKGPFSKLYRDEFSNLRLVKEKQFPYRDAPNIDAAFLLRK